MNFKQFQQFQQRRKEVVMTQKISNDDFSMLNFIQQIRLSCLQ